MCGIISLEKPIYSKNLCPEIFQNFRFHVLKFVMLQNHPESLFKRIRTVYVAKIFFFFFLERRLTLVRVYQISFNTFMKRLIYII